MKIRLFALARELGLDSKVLIELCDEAGVKLRNALATVTPEEKEQIVGFIKNRDSKGSPPKPVEELAPVREDAPTAAKVREIRTIAPRTQSGEASQSEDETSSGESDVAADAPEILETTRAPAAATAATGLEQGTKSEAVEAESSEEAAEPNLDSEAIANPETELKTLLKA